MKNCCTCGERKKLEEFYKDRGAADGLEARCKVCRKVAVKKYYESNREKCIKDRQKWCAKNRDKMRVYEQTSYKKLVEKHPGRYKAKVQLRRARLKQATPLWADLKEIEAIFNAAPKGFHVDHIVPLTHPRVCGLHVPWNLQLLPGPENCRKNNRFKV